MKEEIEKITWWHVFDFDGVKTPGRDASYEKLQFIKMPENLKGWSVLDVGAWDGYFSFEAEKRGAKVLAIDTIAWQENLHWNPDKNSYQKHTKKQGFDFAHKFFKSKVKSKEIDINDLTVDTVGKFDLVLCLGILYHMRDPYKIIRNLAEITKKQIIIETETDGNYLSVPAMIFYPNAECNNDPSVWWGLNVFCVVDMLKSVGFKKASLVNLAKRRAVFHAFK